MAKHAHFDGASMSRFLIKRMSSLIWMPLDEAARAIGAVNTVVNRGGRAVSAITPTYTGFSVHGQKARRCTLAGQERCSCIGNGGASAQPSRRPSDREQALQQMIVVDIVKGNGAISYEECFRTPSVMRRSSSTPPRSACIRKADAAPARPCPVSSPCEAVTGRRLQPTDPPDCVLRCTRRPRASRCQRPGDARRAGQTGRGALPDDTLIHDAVIDTICTRRIVTGTQQRRS